MKRGDKVRVKLLAEVETRFQGKTGTVSIDSVPGGVVIVFFDDEKAVNHQFAADDLELIA